MEEYIRTRKSKTSFQRFSYSKHIHPNALPAAVAAECANEQGKFKDMHDMHYLIHQSQWNNDRNSCCTFIVYANTLQTCNGVRPRKIRIMYWQVANT